ncbi:SGNH/GDSL hydrolase family protein [Bradyrhizobium sp. URHD0069]|uniref:SGNH/GDSL hydrolase family protein n=1 Tax=Bradyrhizobium sp. URHD0069 TaxID=1380355 RepID=UPI0004977458|nr:SGNH/GDSL hydrolase family protein [Bradyrhizobium sp. URHD0069]
MPDDFPRCEIAPSLIRFDRPLFHLAKQLEGAGPINIVAIGSSSTAGEGTIPPYPERLQTRLRLRFPGRAIDVINKGQGGEEAAAEFKRFDEDVIRRAPVLTIWQVGTNAIFHDGYDLDDVAAAIDSGLKRLSALAMDVVLMDLQYAPAILQPGKIAGTHRMVDLISDAAKKAGINVFRRFVLMRRWNKDCNIPIDQMINPADGLHQTDWCTNCVAQALDALISDAAARAYPIIPTH